MNTTLAFRAGGGASSLVGTTLLSVGPWSMGAITGTAVGTIYALAVPTITEVSWKAGECLGSFVAYAFCNADTPEDDKQGVERTATLVASIAVTAFSTTLAVYGSTCIAAAIFSTAPLSLSLSSVVAISSLVVAMGAELAQGAHF